ncbi:hypothetical protein D9M71_719360 [compost metagenome]
MAGLRPDENAMTGNKMTKLTRQHLAKPALRRSLPDTGLQADWPLSSMGVGAHHRFVDGHLPGQRQEGPNRRYSLIQSVAA